MGAEGDWYQIGSWDCQEVAKACARRGGYRVVNAAPVLIDPFVWVYKALFCQVGQGCPFGGHTWHRRRLV